MVLETESLGTPLSPYAESEENEGDLSKAALDRIGETALWGTDWTTETILRQLERGNIDLNPRFQRREAWRAAAKSKFIESLFLGLPVPQLVLAESKDKKGSYIVIDGKQRLLSLRQFAAAPSDETYPPLKLTHLEVKRHLNGLSLTELEQDSRFEDEVRAFHNQPIRTVVLKAWPNEEVLYLVFLRLNTGSVKLSPQELRQALHPGKFVEFVDSRSGEMAGFRKIFSTSGPDFRMRDAELLVRYFAFRNYIADYRGNLKDFLDETCKQLNAAWFERQGEIEAAAKELEAALETTFGIFEENAFTKWNGTSYESSFNRAIFDVMTFYFSQPKIRARAATSKGKVAVERSFKRLCETSAEFVRSVESTTKSISATSTRLHEWGTALGRAIGVRIELPTVGNAAAAE